MDADLTLEKAKRLVRQREAVQGQQAILNKHDGGIPIESLGMRKPHKRSGNKQTCMATSKCATAANPSTQVFILWKGVSQEAKLPCKRGNLSQG